MTTLSTDNIMIAGGCSFSAQWIENNNKKKPLQWAYDTYTNSHVLRQWEYQEPFPVWSEIVAKNQNLKLINTSQAGYGNDAIFHTVIDKILEHKNSIKAVVVMWSNWLRKDIQINIDQWQSSTFVASMERYRMDYFSALYGIGALNGYACVDYFYRYALLLSQICKSFDIKLVQCQGTNILQLPDRFAEYQHLDQKGMLEKQKYSPYIRDWSRKDIVKYFIEHHGFDHLENDDTFIDWPLFREIGGQTWSDIMWPRKNEFWLSEKDSHPNASAHQMYAKKIIDKINE